LRHQSLTDEITELKQPPEMVVATSKSSRPYWHALSFGAQLTIKMDTQDPKT